MSEKRIIEQEASNEVYSDDWFAKDSPTQDTSKILGSDLKTYMNEGMTSADTIADEYDTSTSYDVGDLCFYNGTLYVCTTATTGAWDGNDWSETTIEELIAESGKVQDVKVNGTSVVDVNKVAQIVSYKEVTQAEYNALPSSKNSDNVLYCIKDAVAPPYVEDVQVNGASLVTNKVAILDSLTVDGTASGAIATFSDGSAFPMKSLKVAIEPVQDLHGYDNPWVGGAGKNKFDSDTVLSAFTKNNNKYVGMPSYVANNYVISGGFKTNTRYTLSYKAYNNTSTSSNFRFIFSYTDETEEIIGSFVDTTTEKVIVGTSAENKTISKIKRSYGNGVELTLYDIQLEEGSTATSFAPYSNICPISGWTEEVISVVGKNLFDKNSFKFIANGYIDGNSGQWTGSKTIKEYPTDSLSNYWNSPLIDVTPLKGKTITYNGFISASGVARGLIDENFNTVALLGSSSVASRTVDLSQYPTAKYLVLSFVKNNYSFDNAQLEKGSTATTYEPYNPNSETITIQLGDTYYGGKLDVVSGVLTVDRVIVNVGELVWDGSSGAFYSTALYGIAKTYPNGVPNKVTFEKYQSKPSKAGGFYPNEPNVISLNSNGYLYTAAETTPTGQCVYELATPLTIQLTPTAVKSLLGSNNVWADCGDIINATYIRDLNITINNLINT